MKQIVPFIVCLFISSSIFAQNSGSEATSASSGRIFKKFKTDISLGFMRPQSSEFKVGGLFAVEPKYAVMDELSVGVRIETAVTARVVKDGDNTNAKAKASVSYLATGDYYFSNKKFRPFAGLGAGMYTLASVDSSNVTESQDPNGTGTVDVPTKTKFGFMLRGGFELGHLRFGVEYNFLEKKNGYLGIKIGAVIGGGRKK